MDTNWERSEWCQIFKKKFKKFKKISNLNFIEYSRHELRINCKFHQQPKMSKNIKILLLKNTRKSSDKV